MPYVGLKLSEVLYKTKKKISGQAPDILAQNGACDLKTLGLTFVSRLIGDAIVMPLCKGHTDKKLFILISISSLYKAVLSPKPS